MTARALRRLGAVSLIAVALAACGKKGNPLPPLNIRPASVTDFAASLSGDRVTLQLTVPAANPDDPTVAAPERIEIYRVVTAPGATVPPVSEIVETKGALRGQIAVRRPEDAPASATSPPLPLP